MYPLKNSIGSYFKLNRLKVICWHCLQVAKCCVNASHRSWKDVRDPSDKDWNHFWADPTKVVTNTRHLTTLKYWCRRVAFSNLYRCSSGSVNPLYSPRQGERKLEDNSSNKISSVKGVSLYRTLYFIGWLSSYSSQTNRGMVQAGSRPLVNLAIPWSVFPSLLSRGGKHRSHKHEGASPHSRGLGDGWPAFPLSWAIASSTAF